MVMVVVDKLWMEKITKFDKQEIVSDFQARCNWRS